MPDGGGVRRVDVSQRADADAQVRVFGLPPRKGEQPADIVRGFLEATTSDEADFRTARLYLTEEASRSWRPASGTTVLADGPVPQMEPQSGERRANSATAVLRGDKIAAVDQGQAYRPEEADYQARVRLTRVDGEWRIDRPPEGLVLGRSDFERIYRSVNTYYYAVPGSREDSGTGGDVLVADPVHLRKRVDKREDLVTSTVKALLKGPSDWLDPVVESKFPEGTELVDETLSMDDSNGLRVRLNQRGSRVTPEQCTQMAAQLYFAVQDLASAQVSQVDLADPGGAQLCVVNRGQADAYAPPGLREPSERQYFLDDQGRMVSLPPGGETPTRAPGPFGDGSIALGTVAVSRTERSAAGVTRDGRSLYVAQIEAGAELGPPRLRSASAGPGGGFSRPGWDARGNLWVVDRDPEQPRLLVLPRGTDEPREVVVPALGDGRIESIRVASDGVRIALVVKRGDRTSLELGRIERTGDGPDKPPLSVNGLRSMTPELEQVESASWAGVSRLVVVGRASGVQQLRYVQTDGSSVNSPPPPGANGVTTVAASEDENKPLLAHSEDGIVRLPPSGGNWQLVTKKGSEPAYPG
ncbi:hypothetical protein HCK00_14720 [Streptomyces sp. PLAI1-29]|uniref:GerMN domain-containing protein n=2 Tax=Streptomyces zingiberis TaxID=2053010 RepID=A0ABX1C0T6_9ACTN|nr:hypothetical protein [Streptomyces zingiberis]